MCPTVILSVLAKDLALSDGHRCFASTLSMTVLGNMAIKDTG